MPDLSAVSFAEAIPAPVTFMSLIETTEGSSAVQVMVLLLASEGLTLRLYSYFSFTVRLTFFEREESAGVREVTGTVCLTVMLQESV